MLKQTTMPGYECIEANIMLNVNAFYDYIATNNISGFIISTFYSGCRHTIETSISKYKLDSYISNLYTVVFSIEMRNWSKVCIIKRIHEGSCDDCYTPITPEEIGGEIIYCDSQPRPRGFKNMELYHGLLAFSKKDGIYGTDDSQVFENFCGIYDNPKWQICCSTAALGYIGLVITGDVITASNIDLYSKVDEDGRRYYVKTSHPNDRATRGIISSASYLKKIGNMHDEIVVQNSKIIAIWVKPEANDEMLNTAKYIAEEFNIELRYL